MTLTLYIFYNIAFVRFLLLRIHIIHFVLLISVPVLKITIALRQVYSVGSTFINLNLSMTSWSARISNMQADILSDVILLSDVTPKMIRFSYNSIYSQYVDSMIYIRNARSGFLLDISTSKKASYSPDAVIRTWGWIGRRNCARLSMNRSLQLSSIRTSWSLFGSPTKAGILLVHLMVMNKILAAVSQIESAVFVGKMKLLISDGY